MVLSIFTFIFTLRLAALATTKEPAKFTAIKTVFFHPHLLPSIASTALTTLTSSSPA